jgi:hypothetical protein
VVIASLVGCGATMVLLQCFREKFGVNFLGSQFQAHLLSIKYNKVSSAELLVTLL